MNVANDVTTITKKPTGYVYADFMKPRCFLTLNQLNASNSYEPVKRNSVDDLPTVYYVSKKYFDDAILALGEYAPAFTSIEVTDDFLAQTIFRVVDYVTGKVDAGRTNSSYLAAKIVNTKPYSMGVDTIEPEIKGYMLAKDHFELMEELIANPPVEELQSVSFSSVPDAGAFTLLIAGNETAEIVFSGVASDVQAAINAIVGYETATVTGDYATGFMLNLDTGDKPEVAVGSNTLETATVAVVITVTTTQEGN